MMRKGYTTHISTSIAVAFLLSISYSIQGNNLVDSLSQLLPTAQLDSNKVILLNDLAWELKVDNPQLARSYLDSSLVLSQRLNYPKGQGNAYNYRGVVEDIHGNSEAAIEFFQKALVIRQQLGDEKGVASLHNNIGNVSENLGDYGAALNNYQQSLRLRETLKDSLRMSRLYYNISILHERMGNYPEALDYILRYLETMEQARDDEGVANAYNVIGNIRTELDRFDEAEEAYQNALNLHKQLGNDWETATVLNNLANLMDSRGEEELNQNELDSTFLYFEQAIALYEQSLSIRQKMEDGYGESEIFNNMGYVLKNLGSYYKEIEDESQAQKYWNEALNNLNKALIIRQELNDLPGIMEVYNGFGDVYRRQKDYQQALEFTQKYYDISVKIGDKKYRQNALKDFARIHYQLENYRIAYNYRKDYDELRYDRFTEEQSQTNARREALYSDNKKQYEIERQKQQLLVRDAQLKEATTFRNSLIGGALGLLILLALLYNRNRIKTKANAELEAKNRIIEKERQRSENLLLNILPKETAEELKQSGKAKAVRYDSVTVMFTDFKSFTQIAEEIGPEDLVNELDLCFKAFDEIVAKYGIEKIKTIGDSYMCAAGLPSRSDTHAEDMVKAAMEMQAFMNQFNAKQYLKNQPPFLTRIGINTGPVVAGVVGNRKFAYDIWGDSVNLAARMEENSEAGKINISRKTFELVNDKFECEFRGKIKAKNKGEVDMYFVKGEKNL